MSRSGVDELVKAAKEKSGRDYSENVWKEAAIHVLDDSFFTDLDQESLVTSVVAVASSFFQSRRGGRVREVYQQAPAIIRSVSASAMESNASAQKEYHEKILEKQSNDGAFVHVPTYVAFLQGVYDDSFNDICVEGSLFHDFRWCPGDAKATNEFPRSCGIASWMNRALLVGQKDREQADYNIDVCHQTPTYPAEKKQSATVDVSVLVAKKSRNLKYWQLMQQEHKATASFSTFEVQSSVYATDAGNITNRSVIMIQSKGLSLKEYQCVVYGIVPSWGGRDGPSHVRSFLYEGSGEEALRRVAAGLLRCIPVFLCEKDNFNNGFPLSAIAGLDKHEAGNHIVYKSFDYRRKERVEVRRKSNVDLWKAYVHESAELVIDVEGLQVLSLPYFPIPKDKSPYDPVAVRSIAEIIGVLEKLHSDNFVHGDVRLLNMLVHHGKLVDFDYTDKAGATYPEGLQNLVWDGVRAEEVQEAIEKGKVGELEMKKAHDIESLLAVLRLYDPSKSEDRDCWNRILTKDPKSLDLETLKNELVALGDIEISLRNNQQAEMGTGGTPEKEEVDKKKLPQEGEFENKRQRHK